MGKLSGEGRGALLDRGITQERNMTEGNITAQLLGFSCPILAAQLLQQFYSMADAAVLGHFAEKMSLAAVGPSSLLLSVILSFHESGGGCQWQLLLIWIKFF